MTKCKTDGCVNETLYAYPRGDSDPRREYCHKCVQEFRFLPEVKRIAILANRRAIDQLWDAIMNIDEGSDGYFIELINDACVDEKNPRDDHNIVWQ